MKKRRTQTTQKYKRFLQDIWTGDFSNAQRCADHNEINHNSATAAKQLGLIKKENGYWKTSKRQYPTTLDAELVKERATEISKCEGKRRHPLGWFSYLIGY